MADTSLSQLRKMAEAEGTIGGGGGGTLLPAGTYQAKVITSTAAVNASGKQQFKLRFEVTAGPEAGSKVWETITISPESPKALGIAFGAIDAMGGTAAVERDADAEEVAAAMLGANVEIVTYLDTYNGVERAKVRFINAVRGVTIQTPVTTTKSGNPF